MKLTLILLIGGILFLIFIAIKILALISRGALIDGINKLDSKKKANFKSSFKVGIKKFWKILGIGLVAILIILATLLVISSPIVLFFVFKSYILGSILAVLGIFLFVLIATILSFVSRLAVLFAVCANFSVFSSYKEAYDLLTKKIGPVLMVWIIEIILKIIIGFISFFLFLSLIISQVLIGVSLYLTLKVAGLIVSVIFSLLVLLTIGIIWNGIVQVFLQSVWVLFFKEIATQKIKSQKEKEEVALTKKDLQPVKN